MVTSACTPGSMEMEVICLTISDGLWRSMRRLWILIWNLSQVLEPSPQGVLRVVMRRTLVGILMGPLTLSCFSLAPRIRSLETKIGQIRNKHTFLRFVYTADITKIINLPFSRLFTLALVRVILILWMVGSSVGTFPVSLTAAWKVFHPP